MIALEGATLRGPHAEEADVVVVGSGPAGATVARALAASGVSVVVLEAGPYVTGEAFPEDGFAAMARLYRDLGGRLAMGRAPLPIVQGRAVGGSSPINGAICWRLPEDVHAGWVRDDPALAEALPFAAIERATAEIERDLHVAPTDPAIAGPKNALLARGAAALGLEHRPTRRNVEGCLGLGRCMQGCPAGRKQSMERTYLVEAAKAGARIACEVEALGVLVERGRASGVVARAAGGGRCRFLARGAVVIAASAIDTPALLIRSGLAEGPVGRGFQCHPGVSVSGVFDEPVRLWTGATQGHEVTGLRRDGIKIEALGYDLAIAAARVKGAGRALADGLDRLAHEAHWGAAIRATARGRVRPGLLGGRRPRIRFELARGDLVRVRRAVRVLGELFLAAGARRVLPGVHGWHEEVADRKTMARFEDEGPLDARAYAMVATHLFGTARLHSDPARGVVRPDFRHHAVERLYVADSSVFPSNTGVNPQVAIMALASLAADRILDALGGSRGGGSGGALGARPPVAPGARL